MAMPRALLITTIGLTAIGCFDPGELMPSPSGGHGGTAGAAGAGAAAPGRGGHRGSGIALVTNGDGWLEANPAGAVGSWWSINDYFDAAGTPGGGDCPAAGFPMSACSTLTTPVPGTPFLPDPSGRGMCASGTSAQVLIGSDGAPAWPAIWGNIVGLSLASPPTGAPMPTVGAYDAPAHGITGFAFDIDAVPVEGHLRVMFATPGTENHAAYWNGAADDISPVPGPGHYEVRWPEIGGPFWFAGAPPFDPAKIEWIAFHVVSTDAKPVLFDFCLNNLALLTDEEVDARLGIQ
jgi:hypothetical protein